MGQCMRNPTYTKDTELSWKDDSCSDLKLRTLKLYNRQVFNWGEGELLFGGTVSIKS